LPGTDARAVPRRRSAPGTRDALRSRRRGRPALVHGRGTRRDDSRGPGAAAASAREPDQERARSGERQRPRRGERVRDGWLARDRGLRQRAGPVGRAARALVRAGLHDEELRQRARTHDRRANRERARRHDRRRFRAGTRHHVSHAFAGGRSEPRGRGHSKELTMPTLLIVDDEANIRSSLQGALGREGYQVDVAASLEEARPKLREAYDFVLLDVWFPHGSGLELLSEIRPQTPETVVIMMSGHATIDVAVQATRLGAYDFLEKPISLERLLVLLRNATTTRSLQDSNRRDQ